MRDSKRRGCSAPTAGQRLLRQELLVSKISIDATWSALRLRPEAEVKRTGRGFGQLAGE